MSTPVNYYLYVARGKSNNPGNVTASTSTGGANGDVELRMQIDNGTTTTKLTKLEVLTKLKLFEQYIASNWPVASGQGTNLPAL